MLESAWMRADEGGTLPRMGATARTQHPSGGRRLRRELGTLGAIMMGLGAMLGTGVFVSIGLGAGIVGPAVIVALILAAGVALCNGLSSAQLAAAHPVSGGTYEYGYLYLGSWAGFTAGWVFLLAKSASAATAALGFAGYLLHGLEYVSTALVPTALVPTALVPTALVPTALATLAVLTVVVLTGIRRSNAANVVMVSITLCSLLFFVLAGLKHIEPGNLSPFFVSATAEEFDVGALLEATALMFVAYTGYARIATLGEEVRDPRRTIPRAIVLSAVFVTFLYCSVALVGIGVAGSDGLLTATQEQAAPLAVVAASFSVPASRHVLLVGALTAMLGVLLNLILGLSRVVLAMARRGDVFAPLAALDKSATTPYRGVLAVAVVIGGLVTIGNVRTTWSFSAFSVLIYYALTNLAAWRMPQHERRYPRWIAGLGLGCSLALAFWVERRIWFVGIGLIALGLLWHHVRLRARPRASER